MFGSLKGLLSWLRIVLRFRTVGKIEVAVLFCVGTDEAIRGYHYLRAGTFFRTFIIIKKAIWLEVLRSAGLGSDSLARRL